MTDADLCSLRNLLNFDHVIRVCKFTLQSYSGRQVGHLQSLAVYQYHQDDARVLLYENIHCNTCACSVFCLFLLLLTKQETLPFLRTCSDGYEFAKTKRRKTIRR